MRLLAGILSGQEFRSTLDGDASLRSRPMRRVMDPLTQMGARIHAREGGFAPLKIEGTRLSPIDYTLPVPSAQVKSAVLLAGLFADGVTSVTEPVRTRDHTELALAEFGARIDHEGRTIRIHGRPRLKGAHARGARAIFRPLFFFWPRRWCFRNRISWFTMLA